MLSNSTRISVRSNSLWAVNYSNLGDIFCLSIEHKVKRKNNIIYFSLGGRSQLSVTIVEVAGTPTPSPLSDRSSEQLLQTPLESGKLIDIIYFCHSITIRSVKEDVLREIYHNSREAYNNCVNKFSFEQDLWDQNSPGLFLYDITKD